MIPLLGKRIRPYNTFKSRFFKLQPYLLATKDLFPGLKIFKKSDIKN